MALRRKHTEDVPTTTQLEELRTILFGPEHEKLEEVSSRVVQPQLRTADVAEVLPESIAESFKRDSRLVGALRTPLKQCVAESVRETPEEYADALFPIMGPAIRRAVAEALKSWIQQANHAIEQSLSMRGLTWRFQAWRAGVPYGQYVLQRTLLYRVEHVYLIHSASGLLMSHVAQSDAAAKDEDAVSAMFTAIQEFVRDSFSRAERLHTAELGELTLWAVHGPSSVLVAVIQGSPPSALRYELEAILEQLEIAYSASLRDFYGDRAALPALDSELARCLVASARDPAPRARRRGPGPLLVAASLGALALAVWFVQSVRLDARRDRVVAMLEATPGIVVTQAERRGRTLVLRGLRDPLTPAVATIAAQAGWSGSAAASFEPYLSLEPALVYARARAVLDPPATVVMVLDGDTLSLSGAAPHEFRDVVRGASIAGVARIDASALGLDGDALIAELAARLSAPPTVSFAYAAGRLVVDGEAPAEFHTRLAAVAPEFPSIESVDSEGLLVSEDLRLRALADQVGRVTVPFAQGRTTLTADARAVLGRLVPTLREYAELARSRGVMPRIVVTGRSAPTGSDALNRRLEAARAQAVASALRSAGISASWLATRSQLASGASGERTTAATFTLSTGGAED